jgi:hypothetical protein
MALSKIRIGASHIRDPSPLKGMKSLTAINDSDVAGLLLVDRLFRGHRSIDGRSPIRVSADNKTRPCCHGQDAPLPA